MAEGDDRKFQTAGLLERGAAWQKSRMKPCFLIARSIGTADISRRDHTLHFGR